jgi:glycosyltransferase involved in cell wall biosynthesis
MGQELDPMTFPPTDEDAVTERSANFSATTGAAYAPSFSVLMPAYNAARTISSAISSVLSQTRGDFELIVVDDGSTDATTARVQQYLCDNRVKLISQENRGQASARNVALAAANGRYVSLLDSDDLWLPQYLDLMASHLDANALAAVAYTDAWVLDEETRRVSRTTAMRRWHPQVVPTDPLGFLRALLELGNFVYVSATVRRSVLADVGSFRVGLEPSEDYELWLRIAAHGYPFVRIGCPQAIYRRSPHQMTADQARLMRAASEVFRIVADEYDVPDDVRELARQKLPVMNLRSRRPPRSIPRLLRPTYGVLSRLRHYHIRPPKRVRQAFPDLRSV